MGLVMEESDLERLLTMEEAREILNISEPYMYKLMKKGELKSVKIGKSTRFRRIDLVNFINERVK